MKKNVRPSISRKRAGRFSPNFQGLRVSRVPVYGLDLRSVGVQISGAAGGKVAKIGFAVWRWVTLSGSQIFSNVGIFNFFAANVSRDTCERPGYICET